MFDDAEVRQALATIALKDGVDTEIVYLTLLAIYVLQEAYGEFEDEWELIVSKAKKYLESVGVTKPATFVKKFSLPLVM